jgi:hypothetical protein
VMKNWTFRCAAVVLAVALVAPGAWAAFNLLDRAELIDYVERTFSSLEALLAPGDTFDYEHAAFFSGFLNDRDEHLIVVLLSEDSPSVEKSEQLGYSLDWPDVGILPLFAIMVLPPTDCIRDVDYNVPYLVRGVSWDEGDVVDARGNFVRDVQTWWARGTDEPMYLRFSGNLKIHLQTCVTISMNQN